MNPDLSLTGRRLNESLGKYVANEITNQRIKKHMPVVDSNILVMSLTFKNERWIVVTGAAITTEGDIVFLVRPNESTYMHMG